MTAHAQGRHARASDTEPTLPVTVELTHLGFVNFAMATSDISVVRRLAIRNDSDADLTDVHVGVEVHDLTGRVLAGPWARTIEVVPAGEHVTFESVLIRSDPGLMVGIDEEQPASLVVEVSDGAAGASGATGETAGASGATGETAGASGATGETAGASGATGGTAGASGATGGTAGASGATGGPGVGGSRPIVSRSLCWPTSSG